MSKKEINFMKKKSIDSFLLALEVFNKPTIDYRLEGCVFFLCNAWELLFKAKLLSDNKKITFKDNDGRTYGITERIQIQTCLQQMHLMYYYGNITGVKIQNIVIKPHTVPTAYINTLIRLSQQSSH